MSDQITAKEFAAQQGVNVKSLRAKLRKEFPDHPHGEAWIVRLGSAEYARWLALAADLHAWWEAAA